MSDDENREPARRGAPKGNQFWKARTKHGRDKLFASAELLWESCCEYFQWVEDNPLWEDKVAQFQGGVVDMPVAKMRAMTLTGLCLFLGVTRETWGQWRKEKDFSDVCTRAEDVMYSQKFAGAAADMLNPSIIARDLGLKDVAAHEHTSPDGSMTPKSAVDVSKLSTSALAEILAAQDQSEK